MDSIEINLFETKKNSFCIDQCVKSNTQEFSKYEKQCVDTCFKNMDIALGIAINSEELNLEKA